MAKLIITESERREILEKHDLIKKNHVLVNENLLGRIARSSLGSAAKNAVLSIPSLASRGFKSIDDVFNAIGKGLLNAKQRGEVLFALFKNTKGDTRRKIATIFANSNVFATKYLKSTENATRKALKKAGKYTDNEIDDIINAHRRSTGTAKNAWSSNIRKAGRYANLGDDIKNQIQSIVNKNYPGKQFSKLGQGTREKIIRQALSNTSRILGIPITQEAKGTLRSVLRNLGLTTAAITATLATTSLFVTKSSNTSDDGDDGGGGGSIGETIPENWMDGILNKEWTLMLGSENQTEYDNLDEAIKAFQRALGVNDNGIFGNETKTKVINFQRQNGLTDDGIIGDKTLNKMIENGLINGN